MAKVEMSLNEYNEFKEEMDFLRRVVKELTTPKADDWSMSYARNNHTSTTMYAEVSDEVARYLEDQVRKNTPDELKLDDLKIEPRISTISIGEFVGLEPETEEVTE